jgi:hypothetical protein
MRFGRLALVKSAGNNNPAAPAIGYNDRGLATQSQPEVSMSQIEAADFVSEIPFDTQRIGAAAVYCSDGRFGEQMDDFLHHSLGLPRYDRVAIPGGAACLACYTAAIREEGSLERQLKLLIKVHGLKDIVLIAHQDCAFYRTVRWRNQSLEKQQFEDLSKAARRIRKYALFLGVRAYFARKFEGYVVFEPVPL